MIEKRRITAVDKLNGMSSVIDIRGPYVQQYHTEDMSIYSSQITQSEGHAWPIGRGKWDNGGPFNTIKLDYGRTPKQRGTRVDMVGYSEYRWEGDTIPFSAEVPTPFLSPSSLAFDQFAEWVSPSSERTNLTVLGTKFISQTIPTNPVVDGSVALAELFREGLPSMIGSALLKNKIGFLRSLGSEYLNIEFGWKPLVSDLKSAAKAVIESEAIMQNLVKHSGKDLRRKRLLPITRTITAPVTSTLKNPSWLPSGCWVGPPVYKTYEKTTRQQSFSGCYLYHLDLGTLSEVSKIATQARLIYGLELSPEVIWNLAPWSWLIDWFANVGPLLSNVSAFQQDGLVLRYGYVMEEVSRTLHRSNDVVPAVPQTTHPTHVQDVFHGVWKRREKATPFGFGLNSAAFTNRQWAILGALGLTRIPKVL